MKFKIGDKVRNKINGKIGVIVDVFHYQISRKAQCIKIHIKRIKFRLNFKE